MNRLHTSHIFLNWINVETAKVWRSSPDAFSSSPARMDRSNPTEQPLPLRGCGDCFATARRDGSHDNFVALVAPRRNLKTG
jgi:hypothetical protein